MTDQNNLVSQVKIFNSLVETINKGIVNALTPTKEESKKEIPKEVVKKEVVKKEAPKVEQKPTLKPKEQVGSVLDKWGDLRMSPHFLKVCDYFGVNWEDMPYAEKKLSTIIRWAEEKTGSNDAMDMIRHISKTSRKLPVPASGEKPYTVLHRFIKFGV